MDGSLVALIQDVDHGADHDEDEGWDEEDFEHGLVLLGEALVVRCQGKVGGHGGEVSIEIVKPLCVYQEDGSPELAAWRIGVVGDGDDLAGVELVMHGLVLGQEPPGLGGEWEGGGVDVLTGEAERALK